LSIIIVNYNVNEFLQNLLNSIDKASSNISKEIIVIDNASDDGSVEVIKEKFPSVKLIENKINVGFGRANNQGLEIAKGKFILFINPDCIVSEDTFDKMVSFFESHSECGLAGCKILNSDGTLQLACRRSFPGPWTSFTKVTGLSNLFSKNRIFARYNLTFLDENKTYEVDAVSGSFMMVRKEVYEKVGGFDERFFMYGEDLDLCYRVQKAGYKVYYVHNTQIIHYKGESTKRSNLDETKLFYDAMHIFVKKHLSSFPVVEVILRTAIGFRKLFAFLGKRKLSLYTALIDFIFFNLSLFAAEKLYKSITDWVGFDPQAYLVIYTVPALIHIFVSALSGVYRKDEVSVLRNFGAIIISFLIVTSTTFFFKQYAFSRAVVLIAYILFLIISTFFRISLKLFFKVGIKLDGAINRRTVIVGTDDEAVLLAEKIKSQKSDIHSFIGLIGKTHSDIGKQVNDFKVVGSIGNIKNVFSEKKINEVIFSSEEISYADMMSIVSASKNNNVDFKIVGSDMNFVVGKSSVYMLDDIPLVEVNYNISSPAVRTIKVIFDYLLSFSALISIYPLIYFLTKVSGKETDFRKLILSVPSVISGRNSLVGPKKTFQIESTNLGKAGLTGLWYIDEGTFSDSEKLDFYYVKNQNIWLDLEILGKTLNKMWSKGD
ncbi:MAG: glycosyltransferase, partial [Ignavibacteriaceae bacterium]|nr:glycosyltransferase [Ignavibacteriaceae bacterium]